MRNAIYIALFALVFGCSSDGGSGRSGSTGKTGSGSNATGDPTKEKHAGEVSNNGEEDPAGSNVTGEPGGVELPDYPAVYCAEVGKLETRENVELELSYFCKRGKPTSELLAMRDAMLKKGKGKLEIRKVKEKHYDDDRTDMILAWGYYVDIRPFEVKSRPLNEYIAKNIDREDIKMSTETEEYSRADEDRDHGLHLWTAPMSYDLLVKATDGIDLESARNTQYNMYQVLSGDEEMGFGLESLVDEANPDYKRSIMINVSMNDGTGYNDGVGGTLVFNLLHIEIDNRGFPKTASYAIGEIGAYLADAMYDGLKE